MSGWIPAVPLRGTGSHWGESTETSAHPSPPGAKSAENSADLSCASDAGAGESLTISGACQVAAIYRTRSNKTARLARECTFGLGS